MRLHAVRAIEEATREGRGKQVPRQARVLAVYAALEAVAVEEDHQFREAGQVLCAVRDDVLARLAGVRSDTVAKAVRVLQELGLVNVPRHPAAIGEPGVLVFTLEVQR